VGVAIRLGQRPSEVLAWSMLEVALVAGYCQLEVEQYEKSQRRTASSTPPAAPAAGGAHTVRTHTRYVVKPKEK